MSGERSGGEDDHRGAAPAAAGLGTAVRDEPTQPVLVLPAGRHPAPSRPPSRRLADRIRTWLPVLVPAVILIGGAVAHRWVTEDAFIDFRVVHNLLAGHGPVFNPGERVEVYTDPLWVASLTIFRGAFPFVSIEWWSVVLGIGFATGGTVLGGRAGGRMATRHGASLTLPFGLLMVAVVGGVWDFVTSGLEMGLVFGWLGLSFWLLVRVGEARRGGAVAACVIGLGTLIRPDLVIVSLPLLAALGIVIGSRSWLGPTGWWSRWARPALCAVALPLAYQLWRMAYFALIVPNTALAKSAGTSWWSQGLRYLHDFVSPYYLWIPLLLLAAVVGGRLVKWWREGDRTGCAILAAPLIGGILDALYVVRVGGDFMHARLLLPAFFAIGLAGWISVTRRLSPQLPLVVGLTAWSLVCLLGLRYDSIGINAAGIANERAFWMSQAGRPHPITLADYSQFSLAREGAVLQPEAAHGMGGSPGQQLMLLGPEGTLVPVVAIKDPALPQRIVASASNIGILGVAAGPDVYLFDTVSLANPIGSHTILHQRGRPGHEKVIGLAWMIARFGGAHVAIPKLSPAPATPGGVADARAAIECKPLATYLRAITAPLSLHQALSDFVHSFSYSQMTFDQDPAAARKELCGPKR